MKKIQLISLIIFLFSFNELNSQNKYFGFNDISTVDFALYFGSSDFDFFFGKNSYKEMHFEYRPRKRNWRLKKSIRKSNIGFGFGKKIKVLARFENPNGGNDFVILINKYGDWRYRGPNKWYNIFRKKVLKNL